MYTLNTLTSGQSAVILSIRTKDAMKQRLFDLGFLEGTPLTCLHENFSGDFKAYRIRNTVIALRDTDASHIKITAPVLSPPSSSILQKSKKQEAKLWQK